jgi:Ser/Thr protein kinase RdoA (MazF antagonist)
MLAELAIAGGVVADALEREYGRRNASEVRFIPAGETAWCFAVTDNLGARWFVKLARPEAIAPAWFEFALAVSLALADLGLPVPRPLPTLTGALGCRLGGLQMAVFVDGASLTDEDLRSARVMRQAAGLVAAVHQATSAVYQPIAFVETLEVCSDGLRRALAQLDTGTTAGLVREARELVWPRRAALLDRLQGVQTLADGIRSRSWSRVLCHGDLIGDNLLHDRGGRLWLVDWDAAALAPRELDVSLFTGDQFELFLDGYRLDSSGCDLDPDGIAFFLLRRNLDDLVDWLLAVLDNQEPEAQRRADLDGVRWCMACWDQLDQRIGLARSTLARRR